MNNPFEYIPDAACDEAFGRLTARLEAMKASDIPDDVAFCRELEAGKMLGVLVAADENGYCHTLCAFSGQAGHEGFNHHGFVEPVFDYLKPGGYFKTGEAEISRLNEETEREEERSESATESYLSARHEADLEIERFKEKCRESKQKRAAIRKETPADEAAIAALIRQSQFEKAELRRLKKRLSDSVEPLAKAMQEARASLMALKEKRKSESEELQRWLFTNFRLRNALGESRSLLDIFADTAMQVPPSGAGECCAPKLLQAAYIRGWQPVSMAEYWYGRPKHGEVRRHGQHYPACRGKCLPILRWMLKGLDIEPPLDATGQRYATKFEPGILFENEWFCVVTKPAGMLSVPGKGKALSVQKWLEERYGAGRFVKTVHRLDQDTSGLLIAAFTEESYKVLQSLFATRRVKKTYVAELEGDLTSRGVPDRGRIEIPLAADVLDRPRQRVDFDKGKCAVTEYEITGASQGRTRIIFQPLTGRTHQLRVHSASESGLGMPIAGDRLYGNRQGTDYGRLMLHAHKVEFTFPIDTKTYVFESPVPF